MFRHSGKKKAKKTSIQTSFFPWFLPLPPLEDSWFWQARGSSPLQSCMLSHFYSFYIIFLDLMLQMHLKVPQNSHTWLEANAHAYSFVLLSFRTCAEIPVSQREIFWQDKFKDTCRPLNSWYNSLITLSSNVCEAITFFQILIISEKRNPPHTHIHTQLEKLQKLISVSISHYPSYLNSLYRLRVSTFTRCDIRMNTQRNEYKG